MEYNKNRLKGRTQAAVKQKLCIDVQLYMYVARAQLQHQIAGSRPMELQQYISLDPAG